MMKQGPKNQVANPKPSFLITIDTEGDNMWARPRETTTKNAEYIPRFQYLCESNGFKPTYLTNYEMAESPVFLEIGRDILSRGTGEIGLHLHAWNSPPVVALTSDDFKFHPFLIEYPEVVADQKIKYMIDLLEQRFETNVRSHRAGRWALNESYAKLLLKHGCYIDCSVTPHVSWRATLGDPDQSGGPSYIGFPKDGYFVDLEDISKRGNSRLLELPVTIMSIEGSLAPVIHRAIEGITPVSKYLNKNRKTLYWLRPNGKNLDHLLWIVKRAQREQMGYIQFMLHSSELMPGGSPIFSKKEDIEALYRDLEILFETIRGHGFVGKTLDEYYQEFLEINDIKFSDSEYPGVEISA